MKTHRSSLVVIPPVEVWEPIQRIRSHHDRQFLRWMPHLNLLYPFYPREEFAAAAPLVAEACSTLSPFEVALERFRHFCHPREHFTIWLAPEPAEPLLRLQAALQAVFPSCDEQSRFPGGFQPHLSVGQAVGRTRLQMLLENLEAHWQPSRFEIQEVALIAREEGTPFQVEITVPLGGKS
jgi:2'-5' RNA ligase